MSIFGKDYRLTPFTDEIARKLIVEPVPNYTYQGEAIERILQRSQLVPRHIQNICRQTINQILPDYLTPFENEAANALISQSASDAPLKVPASTMKAIKHHTNNQPLLIQWLCHHLWSRNQEPKRWQITDELLHVSQNDQVAYRFQADFKYLSPEPECLAARGLCVIGG